MHAIYFMQYFDIVPPTNPTPLPPPPISLDNDVILNDNKAH